MAVVINGTSGITGNTGTLISASTIGVGGATPAASGAGITFPATQSASSDANTLDDYEEGTWTPVLTASTTAPTVTYNFQSGVYRKIGSMVYVQFGININSRTGGSGEIRINGLPFTSISRSSYQEPANSLQGGNWVTSAIAGKTYWFVADSATNAFTRYSNNADASISISDVQSNTYINGIMVYCASA